MQQEPGLAAGSVERPGREFADDQEWAHWLRLHHAVRGEVWMVLRKKHVVSRGLTWEAAVVQALRWGWIDSQAQRVDDDCVRQRWTPRRPGSNWSAVNLETVERLLADGLMEPAGLAVYEARRPDRERVYAYEKAPEQWSAQFEGTLRADPRASAFWSAATPGYRQLATHWVVSAKQDATRRRRLAQLVADSAAGQLIPSQRYGTEPGWVVRARAVLESTVVDGAHSDGAGLRGDH